MPTEAIIASLGVVAAIAIAAIAAVWKLATDLRMIESQQAERRHDLRNEVANMLVNSEDRVTQRVVELERNMMILAAHRSWASSRASDGGAC